MLRTAQPVFTFNIIAKKKSDFSCVVMSSSNGFSDSNKKSSVYHFTKLTNGIIEDILDENSEDECVNLVGELEDNSPNLNNISDSESDSVSDNVDIENENNVVDNVMVLDDNVDNENENNVENVMDTDFDDLPLSVRLKKIREQGKWKIQNNDNMFMPTIHPFTDVNYGVQPATNFSEASTPTDIFKFFFNELFVQEIVAESNAYYKKVKEAMELEGSLTPSSRLLLWKDIDCDDFYNFLIVLIYMGNVRLPTIEKYWSTFHQYNLPFARQVMSRNKFQNILRFLHFSSFINVNDRAVKIRPVVDHMNIKFREAYRPGKNIVIDESLMLWKGRLGWKQFIKSKRARFGLKSFDVCESETGYLYGSILYTGKTPELAGVHEDYGLSGKVVVELLGDLVGQGRNLFVDNWYSSPSLFLAVHAKETNICGTVNMKRKGMPKKINEKRVKRGDIVVRHNKTMAFCGWRDKRFVKTLTTFHTPALVDTNKLDRITKTPIRKPNVVVDYNDHMGGVDLVDQVTSAYPSMRKSLKWYKKYFLHIMDICLYNTMVIFNCLNLEKKNYLNVRESVIDGLLEAHHRPSSRHSGGRRSDKPLPQRINSRCFPSAVPATAKRKDAMKRCAVCKKHGLRKESRYECKTCEVALCVVPCFEVFHTKKNF